MANITPNHIFSINNEADFESVSLEVFRFQASACPVYREYIQLMRIDPLSVKRIDKIPFLPVSFFKEHLIYSGEGEPEMTFVSSGTTGTIQSRHAIRSLSVYEESLSRDFTLFYGDPSEYAFFGLLPSYIEREGSSLIYMVNKLIELSGNHFGGFYLHDYDALLKTVCKARETGLKVFLIGVTFALLDLAEKHPCDMHDVIIMETGGMKGRREELIREELHSILSKAFNVSEIHSEYGMTELLSQAYSKGNGLFSTPPWMRVLIRDSHDPLSHTFENGASGGISVIDLANLWSCSFIATSDLGRMYDNGMFEVLGRFDNADIRGCNLLV